MDTGSIPADYEVVVVTYFSRDQLEVMLSGARPDQRLVVVDNASDSDGVKTVVSGFERSRWIDGENSGFACAANRGGLSSDAEYLVFVDPDSHPTPEVWDALVDDLRADPSLGIVSASGVDARGRIEIGVGGWEPTPARAWIHALGLHRLMPKAGVFAQPELGEAIELDWVGGPCMAVRRSVFADLGGFDERYFVYNEDVAFGLTVRDAGLGVRLRTDLPVKHDTSGSGGGGKRMLQQRGASMAAFLTARNRRIPATLMRTAFAVGMLPRILVALLRGRPELARAHLGYLEGMVTKRSPFRP